MPSGTGTESKYYCSQKPGTFQILKIKIKTETFILKLIKTSTEAAFLYFGKQKPEFDPNQKIFLKTSIITDSENRKRNNNDSLKNYFDSVSIITTTLIRAKFFDSNFK